jgi:4-hydroxyphenylpyruvate dioxygenase-like putative hemolysin
MNTPKSKLKRGQVLVRIIGSFDERSQAAPFFQLLKEFAACTDLTSEFEGIDFVPSGQNEITDSRVEILLGQDTLHSSVISVGRDSVITTQLAKGGNEFVRCTIDHVAVCLNAEEAPETIKKLLAVPAYSQIKDVVALTKMSDGISATSILFAGCEFNIVVPMVASSPLSSFLEKTKKGGIQHFAVVVNDLDKLISRAKAIGVRTLRDVLEKGRKDLPIDRFAWLSDLMRLGFVEDRTDKGLLRQTFVVPNGFPRCLLIEFVERRSFEGYSESNASALFNALALIPEEIL